MINPFYAVVSFFQGRNMNKQDLLKKISELESLNDQLLSEYRYLDDLLKEIGFEEGIKTLKFAAQELLDQDKNSTDQIT